MEEKKSVLHFFDGSWYRFTFFSIAYIRNNA